MAYDEALAARIHDLIGGSPGLSEMKMFGGLAFLINGHMAVAASGKGGLMARVDPESAEQWIDGVSVEPMEMRNKHMPGWLRVTATSVKDDDALQEWIDRCVDFTAALPPKTR